MGGEGGAPQRRGHPAPREEGVASVGPALTSRQEGSRGYPPQSAAPAKPEKAVPALTFHAAFIFRKRRSYYKKKEKASIIRETNVINLNPAVESLSFLTPRLSFAISSDINHHILYLPFDSVTNRANDNSTSVVPRSCRQLLPTSLGGKGGASLLLHMKILTRNRFALVNCELS